MRYLSQLARETTARVSASRQPPWLRPVGMVAKNEFVPLVAAAAPNVRSGAEGSPSVYREAGASPAEPERQVPRGRSVSSLPAANVTTVPRDTAAEATASRVSTDAPAAARPATLRQISVVEKQGRDSESSSAVSLPERGQVEGSTPPKAETTLRSVLAEMARRQEELERQQVEARRARTVDVPQERHARSEGYTREAASKDEVRVSIGSIVVQVEPDPPPALPQPRQRATRDAHENNDRWARSFLDR